MSKPKKEEKIKIKPVSAAALREINKMNHVEPEVKYTEYRSGLMRAVSEKIADQSLTHEEQRKKFIKLIGESKDLKNLMIDNMIVEKLDSITGIPKILLTVYAKWVESRFI